jgi:TPR repeat protein
MNLLARCYEEGWGVARDPGQAAFWYRRSAEEGYFRGQFNYATLLANEGEIDLALVWFEKAFCGEPSPSLAAMAEMLARHPEPRLAALGRRKAAHAEPIETAP